MATAAPAVDTDLNSFLAAQAAAQASSANLPGMKRLDELGGEQRALRAKLADTARAAPTLPAAAPLPARPDTIPQAPGWEFLLAMAPMILLGSKKSRAPMTTALQAAAGALTGYNQGQQEVGVAKEKEWRDQLDTAIRENQQELQRYQAAIDKHKGDMDAVVAEIQAVAADRQDEVVKMQMANGQFDQFLKVKEMKEGQLARLQMHADSLADRAAAREAAAADRAAAREQANEFRQQQLDLARERLDNAEGGGAKARQADAMIGFQIGQIDKLLDPKNPEGIDQLNANSAIGAAGIKGYGSRVIESVLSNLGMSQDTSASTFQAKLETLKAQIAPLIVGNSRTAVDQRARLDTIIRGLGPGQTLDQARSSLKDIRDLLSQVQVANQSVGIGGDGAAAPAAAASSPSVGADQPPVPGAVAGTYNGKPVWRAPDGKLYAR